MGKKKIFKDDGSEDFDAESKELDEGTESSSDDALKDTGFLGQAELPQSSDKAPEHDYTPDALKADADKPVGKDAPVDAPKVDEVTDADAAKAADEGKTEAPAPAPALSDKDGSMGGGVVKDSEAAQGSSAASADSATSPAPSAEAPAAAEKSDEVPEFTEAHTEAQAIVEAAPDALDLLKEAGNKLAPALKKFQEYEEKFSKLEDEAKARFQHLRQKATEAVAALEAIFKRG